MTWLINFIKWNAGIVKYRFQHKPSNKLLADEPKGWGRDQSQEERTDLDYRYSAPDAMTNKEKSRASSVEMPRA